MVRWKGSLTFYNNNNNNNHDNENLSFKQTSLMHRKFELASLALG